MTSSIQSRLGTAPEEGCKAPVKTVANNPITLSGEQTINTVAVVAGDRVLVNGQVDSSENGIYNVSTTAWTYAKDWNKSNDVIAGMLIPVSELTQVYQLDTFSGTYTAGNTDVTFTVLPATATTGITHTRGVTDYTLSDFLNTTIPTETVINRATLAAATADTTIKAGDAINLAERTTGNGGGAMWDVIAGTGTANGLDKVAHDTLSLTFVQRRIRSSITVNIPTDFDTLESAINYYDLSKSDVDAEIILNIETGHAITKGLGIFGGDYSRFKITSDDSIVYLAAGFVGVDVTNVPLEMRS
jgi:hypothetical protein